MSVCQLIMALAGPFSGDTKMRNLILTGLLSYEDMMHDDDEKSFAVFRDCVLFNEEEPPILHSNAFGDEIGTIRVLSINEPDRFMTRLTTARTAASATVGRFITIEGIEGCGKTTLLEHLQRLFIIAGCPVVATQEPGGTMPRKEVGGLVSGHRKEDKGADAKLLRLFAARAEHLEKVIRPALAAGKWVLCDRYIDTIHAYQRGGWGIAEERITALESWIQNTPSPDLTILLDIPVEMGLIRAGRDAVMDRFACEEVIFLERVRTAYLALAAAQPKRFRIVDASRPLPEIKIAVSRILEEWFYGESLTCLPFDQT
ncbi:dTMP kinase [Gammaproteobacteria bacterium]